MQTFLTCFKRKQTFPKGPLKYRTEVGIFQWLEGNTSSFLQRLCSKSMGTSFRMYFSGLCVYQCLKHLQVFKHSFSTSNSQTQEMLNCLDSFLNVLVVMNLRLIVQTLCLLKYFFLQETIMLYNKCQVIYCVCLVSTVLQLTRASFFNHWR